MRLVATLEKENLARRFALFLEKEKIENTLEPIFDKKLKKTIYNVWVHNEDELDSAIDKYKSFMNDPANNKYDVRLEGLPQDEPESEMIHEDQSKENPKGLYQDPNAIGRSYPYKLTFFFLFICVALYFVNYMQEINILKKYNFKQIVLLTPLQKTLLYDIPSVRLDLDQVIIKYRLDTLKKLENPPKQAQEEIEKIENKPAWRGLYDIVLEKLQKQNHKEYISPPLFEKISHGQVWRLFTPAILHSGFLHILFNMLWLWYLGKQMESRLRFTRYFLFIIIVGVLSNTAQYLMGGPYFLGFSGIITGMVGYIFVRQKIAPWEGYNIPNAVFYFIAIFIFAMLFLQIVSFIMQIFKPKFGFAPGIANTAHIAGAIIGMILAKIPFFTWRTSE